MTMRPGWWVLAALLTGCLLQPRPAVEVGDEQWGIVCRVLYTGFGRSTTVYLRLEQFPRPLIGTMTVDDQCKVTIRGLAPDGDQIP